MTARDRLKLSSIAVDLDGTLAFQLPGKFNPKVIGKPITAMRDRVRRWLADGEQVKIFTARAADPKNIKYVREWLAKHGFPGLEITNRKTPDITELWDDRAVGIVRNKGTIKSAFSRANLLEGSPLHKAMAWGGLGLMGAAPAVDVYSVAQMINASRKAEDDPTRISTQKQFLRSRKNFLLALLASGAGAGLLHGSTKVAMDKKIPLDEVMKEKDKDDRIKVKTTTPEDLKDRHPMMIQICFRKITLLQPMHKRAFVDVPGDYAPGIERPRWPGDMSQIQPGNLLDYVIQRHDAHRRGPHYDLRAGTPETGLFSFAGPTRLPKGGERIPIARTNVHRHGYKEFEGEIPKGKYGAGTVKKVKEGKLLITKTTPNSFHFSEASGPVVKRYALIKPPNPSQAWLLVRAKPLGAPTVEKEHFDLIDPEQADEVLKKLMDEGAVVQPKVDGALVYARLAKGRIELTSHRTSKRTGGAIPHTERVFGQSPEVKYPKDYENMLLRGEVFGTRKGKTIPPQELGGILNAGIARSLAKQKEQDVKLQTMLFGLAGSKDPYDVQRKTLEDVMQYLPQEKFMLPEEARTYEDARSMLEQIRSGRHPLTQEGVVVHPQLGTPSKIKFRPEEDVEIAGVFPGEGKYKDVGAGGFTYKADGAEGRVGTGLTDAFRKELFAHPELYLGRTARITSQGQFPSGLHRAPSFISLHEG